MTYLLDSDWLADFLTGRPSAVGLVQQLLPDGVAISVVCYMEIMEGIRGSRDPVAAEQGFRRFLQGVEVLDLNQAIADQAATIRLDLRRRKRPIDHRAMDLLVAATALEHGLILVSRNSRDYGDIAGLRLYGAT